MLCAANSLCIHAARPQLAAECYQSRDIAEPLHIPFRRGKINTHTDQHKYTVRLPVRITGSAPPANALNTDCFDIEFDGAMYMYTAVSNSLSAGRLPDGAPKSIAALINASAC